MQEICNASPEILDTPTADTNQQFYHPDYLLTDKRPFTPVVFIEEQVKVAQETCKRRGEALLPENPLFYKVEDFKNRATQIISSVLAVDKTIAREIYLISQQVVYHQGEYSASPKIYHSPEHTLQVLSGIVGFLLRNETTLKSLEPAGVKKLLFTCLIHDVNHNYSFYHPGGATVKKDSLNEIFSEKFLASLGISFEDGDCLNHVTKVDPGNFDMGQVLVVNNLTQLLSSNSASKKDKIISFLLQYYDTFPKNPHTFFKNGLKIWMEEFALVALFKALDKNTSANGSIASWELNPKVSKWSEFKLDLIAEVRGVSNLEDFYWVIEKVCKRHNITESDQQMICDNLYGGLKFFLGVQSIIAANFKQNAQDALKILQNQSLVDEQFIVDLNLDTFDQAANSASVINLITTGVSDYDTWKKLVTHLTQLNSPMDLVKELFGPDFDIYKHPAVCKRALELTQAKEPNAQQPMHHLFGRALFELVTGKCQRSATLTRNQLKECILSKEWKGVDTNMSVLDHLKNALTRLSENFVDEIVEFKQ
jgi:hypothetical protein